MTSITPIILAGGSGTRLWPLSRKTYPKQFSTLFGNKTLFQKCALRVLSSEILKFQSPLTVTNSDFRFIVAEQLQSVGIDPGAILIEPKIKNTAPAILAASLYAFEKDPDAILLVTPSDHIISDTKTFHKAIRLGLEQVKNKKFVTFGITPFFVETGYGYLEIEQKIYHSTEVIPVTRFVEKPNYEKAKMMIDSGNYLFNSGIFLFKAVDMINSFQTFSSRTLDLVKQAVAKAVKDLGFFRLDNKSWSALEAISIDYAIMEKAKNLVAVRYNSDWSDLGDWNAVWNKAAKDKNGNVTTNGAHAINCTNSLLRSESPSQQIVGLGIENIIAIAMPDAVLVAQKDEVQDVKKVVEYLKSKSILQAEFSKKVHRPWGWFESLVLAKDFQVKRIIVKPGAALSLQSHQYRSEHWVVVKGVAKVTVNNKIKNISVGQSIYVPVGAIHRLENLGKLETILIEVQIGTYFGEDDIVRYDDIYKRKL